MRLYLPILAVFLCVLLDALASLPSGTDYYGRIKDATPVVTNAWQSVQKDVEGLVDAKIIGATNAVSEMIQATLSTNDVCNIVTNEVIIEVDSGWQLVASDPTVQKALDDNKTTIVYESGLTESKEWVINNPPGVEGFFISARDSGITDENAKSVFFGEVYVHSVEYYSVSIVATRTGGNVKRNALGLAKYEDLTKLPTHETVTNVARAVVNSVWDAQLGVAWQARMHNGHLYYIAVTNQPTGGK